jgi:hypothetical protein
MLGLPRGDEKAPAVRPGRFSWSVLLQVSYSE